MAYERYESLLGISYDPYRAEAGMRKTADALAARSVATRALRKQEPEGAVSAYMSGPYVQGRDVKTFAEGRGGLAGHSARVAGESEAAEQLRKRKYLDLQFRNVVAARKAEIKAEKVLADQVISAIGKTAGTGIGLALWGDRIKKRYDARQTTETEPLSIEVGEDPLGARDLTPALMGTLTEEQRARHGREIDLTPAPMGTLTEEQRARHGREIDLTPALMGTLTEEQRARHGREIDLTPALMGTLTEEQRARQRGVGPLEEALGAASEPVVSEQADIIIIPGDTEWEYAKREGIWYTRKVGQEEWGTLPQSAIATVEAELARQREA